MGSNMFKTFDAYTLTSQKLGNGREAKMGDHFSIKNHDRDKTTDYHPTKCIIRSKFHQFAVKLSIYLKVTLVV